MKFKLMLLLAVLHISLSNNYGQDEKLKRLIDEALKVSPKLKLYDERARIAESIVPQVSNLPDPVLTVGLNNLPVSSFSFSEEAMTSKIVGLSQAIPFPGKLSAAGKVKEKDKEIIIWEKEEVRNQIVKEVSKLYYELVYTREAIRIAGKSKSLLKDISKILKTKYSVSIATQQNLLKTDLEITNLNDELESLKGTEKGLVASINSLLLRPIDALVETDSLDKAVLPEITFNRLIEIAKENRPQIKSILASIEKTDLMENLAEYSFYPDFSFKIQYSQRGELKGRGIELNDFVSFIAGISIPINYGGKKSAKVEEARLRGKFYESKFNVAIQEIYKKIGDKLAGLQSIAEREKLITEGMLPQAKQSLKAALASYRVGKSDYINVLDSQNKLFKIEKLLLKLRADFGKETVELEYLTGAKLNEINSGEEK